MRFILISIVFFISASSAFSQNGRTTAAIEEFPLFQKTTMLVVLFDNEPEYNRVLVSSIEKYWTFTPFKFIQFEELNEYINDRKYSMMIRNNSERIVKRVGRTDRIKSNHFAIYNGNKGMNMRSYTGADAIAQYRFKDINQTSDYAYKLPAVIQSMQHYFTFMANQEKLTEDNHEKLVEAFCNELSRTIGKKTLYIMKDQLPEALQDIEKLEKAYKYGIKIVDKETLAQAIEEQNADVAFLHTDTRIKEIYILAAAGGRILYHDLVNERGSLTKKDFVTLSKKAGY